MFELTNEQRVCFGLATVEPHWTRIAPKPSPYDGWTTIAYLDGTVIRKFIETGSNTYTEYELCEQLSDDLRYLLPKTAKGKPVLLSAATLKKRTGIGMCLSYTRHRMGSTYIALYSPTSQKCYYSNDYESVHTTGIDDFRQWVEQWCAETTPEDLADIARFAVQPRQHVKFKEGDVFRFKINRRLYGYGRILLDYALMRKKKVPFWDVLAGKPLACSVYHIVTDRTDVSIAELEALPSLPSVHMMDNRLFYGDFEIIGNIPIGETEDYPIMYGGSIDARYRATLLQCGKLYRRDDNIRPLFNDFMNQGIGFDLRFRLPVLLECIEADSNEPYWAQDNHFVNRDLRNPKFRAQLAQVCEQFCLSPAQLLTNTSTEKAVSE
ncbi:MAG: immunity 26/phosphotriesterase HocA family protein [Oscillospiraceae bacterium]|nr:immunity 26/phosphotriesterase HocA family protein [Oscillospiraceae bacterium]